MFLCSSDCSKDFKRRSQMMEDRVSLTGTCTDMCPFKERRMREQQHRLHPLEMVPGTEKTKRPQADPQSCVKEYSRPAAGKAESKISDLRPPDVLIRTVKYLVHRVLIRHDIPWVKLYNFVFDRLRSVRQDMVIQRLTGDSGIEILQWTARFHIYAAYRLCQEPMSSFDPKINQDHTQECLKRLLVLYQLSDDSSHLPYRAEFESLYLLHNLGSTEASRHALTLPKHIRCEREMQSALAITSAFWEGNFIRLWRMSAQCSYIQSCALHRHMANIRWQSLRTLNTAYSSKNLSFPTVVLSEWLLLDSDEETVQFCLSAGLEASLTHVKFYKCCLQNDCPKIDASYSFKLVGKKWQDENISSIADIIMATEAT